MAAPDAIFARLQALAGDAVRDFTPAARRPEPPKEGAKPTPDAGGPRDAFCKVDPARWLEVARLLRDDPELRFDFLQSVTAVDWPKQSQIHVVYHLYSYALRHELCVKAELPRDAAVIPSVAGVWGTAEWNEREQFDLVGVGFSGHPDLRRVMLPDDWVGHPLRKDWKEPAFYRGMATSRPSPLELLPAFDKAPDDKKRLPVVAGE